MPIFAGMVLGEIFCVFSRLQQRCVQRVAISTIEIHDVTQAIDMSWRKEQTEYRDMER